MHFFHHTKNGEYGESMTIYSLEVLQKWNGLPMQACHSFLVNSAVNIAMHML